METITPSLNRREMLAGLLSMGTLAALPKPAIASQQNEVKRGVDAVLEGLAKPRIDEDVDKTERAEFSKLAGFPVEEVSVPLKNRVSLETVRLLYGKNGEFAWHWTMAPGGMVPFVHKHVDEEEVIHLIRGEISCVLEGEDEIMKASAKEKPTDFVIPKDCLHLPFNEGDEDVVGIVHFENPEETRILSTVYWNMVEDGEIEPRRGRPKFRKLLLKTASLDGSRTNLRFIPEGLQDFGRKMAQVVGTTKEELLQEYGG